MSKKNVPNSNTRRPQVSKTAVPHLLRVTEVAQALSISRSKLYELIATGDLESFRIGGCRRISADAVHRLLENSRRCIV